MRVRKAITLRLGAEDYERLEEEARRLSMQPGTLARVYILAALAGKPEREAERKRRVGMEALDRLMQLTAGLPPVDAVRVARESREELDRKRVS